MARLPTVDEVNAVAERLYASPDPADRQAAQLQLTPFTVEGGDNTVLLNILANSSNQYALLFAAQGIVSWFKANLNWITQEQREQIVVQQCGIACLQRLILHGAPRHVLLSLLTAYAKMTKLSFEKEPVLKPAVDHALNLFSASQCYLQASGPIPSGVDPVEAEKQHFLSLLLLDTLVTELGKFDSSKTHSFMSFAAHRRSSNNFRDECLLSIFMAVISELELVQLPQQKYPSEVVELTKNCLGYDFMAITVDETEEALSSQVPADWKPFLLSSKTQQVLWGQHATLPYPLCATLLTGLSSLCGIRRTFFDSPEERVEYLNSVLDLLCNVAKDNGDRFVIPHYVQIYAEVCQRLVAPFGYRDLHMSGCFARWVETLRAISVDVFAVQFGRDGSFGTTTTLLNFWSRLLMSRRMYVGPNEEEERDLHTMAPDLVLSFVQSRVHFIPGEAGALEEEDYDAAMEAILTQSESVASMALTDFPRTMSMLADYVHRGVGSSVLESPTATAWLFYLAGQLVHQALPHVEENSVEMVSNFFIFCVDCANHRRLALSNNPPPSSGGLHLGSNLVERALIFFINTVQLVLTGPRNDEALKSVIARVFESRAMLFQFILNNTGHNLMRGLDGVHDEESAQIIKSSIDLIANACRDVPPAMLEVLSFNLPPVVDLPLSRSRKTYKLRTNLYTVLWTLRPQQGKMLGVEEFLQPITTCLLNTVNGGSTVPSYVAGWLRDLRGVCRAIHDERQSELVEMVEWFCENAGAFHSVLSGPAGASPMVVVSFLRFLEELVSPHSGRLNLPNGTHSACGLLLFKHMCALLQLVVERCITNEQVEIVSAGGIVDGAYELMLKPLWLSMSCLRRCVHDGFVPFGAMWHYRDETYDNTLLGLLRMLTVFPPKLCKEYPKVVLAVVDLIRTITEEEAYQPLAKLSTAELESIISFVVNVCEDVDTESGSLFHGLSFLSFVAGLIKEVKALSVSPSMTPEPPRRNSTPPSPIQLPSFYSLPDCGIARISGTPGGRPRTACRPRTASREAIARLLEPLSGLWQRLVAVAMNVIVTQDRGLSVSCTVVYPIFEAHPPFWQQFVESFVATYPARKQQAVREALSKLSNDADSQDHFFSGVFTFRQTLRSI